MPKTLIAISQERVKVQTSNLASTFIGSIRTKVFKNVWRKGAWAYPGTVQFLGYPYYLRNG